MKSAYFKQLTIVLFSISLAQAAKLNWDFVGSAPGSNGTGSYGGATLADATHIGNGTGVNEWDVGSGADTTVTHDNTLISNTFNSSALTGGFDVTVSVDATGQTMGYNETYTGGYLQDSPAVGLFLDGGTDDALSLRMDTTSGTVPKGNADVKQADLIAGTKTWNDLTAETIVIMIDPKKAVMSNAVFNLYEIDLLSGGLPGEDGDGNWDHERVVVTGYTTAGLAVLPTLTKLVTTNTISPVISANSASGRGSGTHSNPDTGVEVKFDGTEIDYIKIEYEMRRITSIGGTSFGLGVGDITYDIRADKVPEPFTPLLLSIAGLGIILRRNRRD